MPDGIQWNTSGIFSHASGQHTDVAIPTGNYGPYPFLVGGIATRGGGFDPGDQDQDAHANDHTIELIVGGVNVTSTLGGTGVDGVLANQDTGGFVNFFGNNGIGGVWLVGIPLVLSPWVERGYNVPSVNPLDGGGTIRITTNSPTIDPIDGYNIEVGTYAWAILSTLEMFTPDFDDPILGPILTTGPVFQGISVLDGVTDIGAISVAFGGDFDDSEGTTRDVTVETEILAQYQPDGVTPSINFDPSSKYMVGVIAVWFDALFSVDFPVASAPSWGSPATTVVSRTNLSPEGQATVSIGLFAKTTDPISDLTFSITNAPLGDAGGAAFTILGKSSVSANHKPRSYAQIIG